MIQLEDRSWWIFGASVPELHASSQKGVCSAKQRPNHADKYIVSNLDNYSCPKTSCKDCSCVPWWQRRTRNQRGFHNSSDLTHTHLNIGYLGWLRTTYHRQGNKLVTKRLWACLKAERRHRGTQGFVFMGQRQLRIVILYSKQGSRKEHVPIDGTETIEVIKLVVAITASALRRKLGERLQRM